MARVTVEDCLEFVPSRFALVMLVAKRAKQLMKGDYATVHIRGNKNVVTALREVAAGNVKFEGENFEEMISEAQKDLNKIAPAGRAIDGGDLGGVEVDSE